MNIQPGVYRHKNGGRYTVIAVAQDSTNDWGLEALLARLERGHPVLGPTGELGDAMAVALTAIRRFNVSAQFESTQEPVIIYVSHTTGNLCVRRAAEFCEVVPWPDGVERPRFAREVTP